MPIPALNFKFLFFYMHFDVLVVFSLSLTFSFFSIKSLFPVLLHHPAEHWIGVHHGRHGRMLDRLKLGRLGDQVVSRADREPGAVVAALITIVWRCKFVINIDFIGKT